MIDLHCHLLPGADDGASDLAESLAMCRQAAADGCTAMIATPHLRHEHWWNEDRNFLEKLWRQLRKAVAGILDIHLGGEIAIHSQSVEELDTLPGGALLPLAGSRYLLLEFDRHGLGPPPLDLIHELQVTGWRPIIAHPERIRWLATQPTLLREIVAAGASLQLTAMSLTGRLGKAMQDLCFDLLDAGLVDFVASDAHDTRIRPPGLSEARDLIHQRLGTAAAQQILVDNPSAVLLDRPLKHGNSWPKAVDL
jgi:protein-tyrosine phosphatase